MNRFKKVFFTLVSTYYKLRYKNIEIDKGVRIYPSTSFAFLYCNKSGSIKIGKDAIIGCRNKAYRMGWWHPVRLSITDQYASIVIGEGSYINGVNICAKKSIIIGKRCHFASGVQIIDYNGHLIYSFDRLERDEAKPVIIGNNVWVGLNSIILKGTEIGDNSIVAAGSVVKGQFPPYSLIAGNPAKIIKILDKNYFK